MDFQQKTHAKDKYVIFLPHSGKKMIKHKMLLMNRLCMKSVHFDLYF